MFTMEKFVIEFNKRGGRKKVTFKATQKDLQNEKSIQTVFEQFILDLPIDLKKNDLIVNKINGVDLKDEHLTFNDIYQALNIFTTGKYDFANEKTNPNNLIVTKQMFANGKYKLEKVLKLDKWYFEFVTALNQKESEKDKVATDQKEKKPDPTETDPIIALSQLQAKAKDMEKSLAKAQHLVIKQKGELTALKDGQSSFNLAKETSIQENYALKTKINEYEVWHKDQLKWKRALQREFGTYIKTENDRNNFAQQLLMNLNSPMVQNLIHQSYGNLGKLLVALSSIEDK